MFLLAAVLCVPAPRDCGAGMQIEPARGLVCRAARGSSGTAGSGG